MKGGYKIINLKNLDLTPEIGVTIDGIYQAVANEFKKQLMLADVKIDGKKQTENFVISDYVSENETYTIKAYGGTITITNKDVVTYVKDK